MAVTHLTASRDAMAEAIRGIANAGTTPVLVIGTSALSGATGVLASITIPDFGASSSGVITSAASGNSATASASGTAAKCEVRTSGGTTVFFGAVSTSGSDVNISSVTITSGDTVTLSTNVTWTAPA